MTETHPSPLLGLLLSRDLFFTSKVTGTAQALGRRIEAVADPAQAAARMVETRCPLLLIDLDLPGLDLGALLATIGPREGTRVIAFGPHVEEAKFREAREAGCDEVMPRSKFSANLAAILQAAN